MKRIFIAIFCIISINTKAQLNFAEQQPNTEKLSPRELTIPTSPLFDLMGVAPSQVAHTANIKDFKVDWSFANWRLNPNLAIQAQPIWELLYNKSDIKKYQNATGLGRMLSSLDVSIGTVQTFSNDRRIGGALKLSLLKQNDPLLIKGAYDGIQNQFNNELKYLQGREKEILKALDTLTIPDLINIKKQELARNDLQLASFYSRRNSAIQQQALQYTKDKWNSAFIDIAFGKIFTYETDSAGSLKKLKLNRNTGNGVWLNFGFGIGKRGLISGLIRSSFYEEDLTFLLKDNSTGIQTQEQAVASNKLITLGINFRYGGPVYNFFAEFIYEGKTVKTANDALNEVFKVPNGATIISNSVKWDIVNPYIINFGGDWRISRNVILNYGIRCIMDKTFKNTTFTPIANISCMMR